MMKCVIWTQLLTVLFALVLLASAACAERPVEQVVPTPRCNKHATVWRTSEMPGHAKSGDIRINPIDGMEMVYVAAGKFHMGSDQVADERPYRKVHLDAYWIARNDVTVAQFRKFCAISGHAMPMTPALNWLENSPIVNVDWNDAAAYAKWANGRLPSEAEWEKAAGGDKTIFPWGNAWDATRCNNGLDGPNAPCKVGSFPLGASQYGVMDMAGNVAQWCADQYARTGDSTDYRVIRGGSCRDVSPETYRTSRRDYLAPSAKIDVVGFRYVLDAKDSHEQDEQEEEAPSYYFL